MTYVTGRVGRCFKFDGKGAHVDFGNPKDLQITGGQTIAMWIRPDRLGPNLGFLSKAYGGELDVGAEETGGLIYHYGQAGRNSDPYIGLRTGRQGQATPRARCRQADGKKELKATGSGALVKAGRWTHIAIVRDLKAKRLRWYVNARIVAECEAIFPSAKASGEPMRMGRSHTGLFYAGLIDEVGVWNRALTAGEIRGVAGMVGGSSTLARGLVGYWPADGNAKDAAGSNHGRAVQSHPHAMPPFIGYVADRHGKNSSAFGFPGAKSCFINVGDDKSLDTDDAFTLSTWVNQRPSRGRDRLGHLIVKWGAGAPNADYSLEITSNGPIDLNICDGKNEEKFTSRASVPVGNWTHLAVTFAKGKVKLFINGKLDSAYTCKSIAHTNRAEYDHDDVTFGQHRRGGSPFYGAMDDIAIWSRALAPAEVKSIFEAPDLGTVLAASGAPLVMRSRRADRAESIRGDVLMGKILNDKYVLTTSLGKLTIPAEAVAGIAGEEGGGTWLVLADGQAICGKLADGAIKFKVTTGSTLTVPVGKIRQCGYKISAARPDQAKVDGPLIELIDGQRLAWTGRDVKLQLTTPHGDIALPARSLLNVEPTHTGHQVQLANGSTLSGKLAAEKLSLKLALGPAVDIPREEILRLTWPARAAPADAAATVALRNGDKLLGEIADRQLTIHSDFGEVKLAPTNTQNITFDAKAPGKVKARTWDGGTISGQLAEETITVALGPDGPEVKVKVATIVTITRSTALPPAEVIKKIEKLIARLGAANFKDREDATNELIRIGKPARGLLEKHRNDTDPEVRPRIERILEAIGPDTPPKAGGAIPPPGGWNIIGPHVGPVR